MPLDLKRFVKTRPFLYHLTARGNVKGIRAFGGLRPAADILREARCAGAVRVRRRASQVVETSTGEVHIRDQAPLHAGNMRLSAGWSFPDFVEHLNEHVFFWPGNGSGPISYGLRHFARYAEEDNVVLVTKTAELLEFNAAAPKFCAYNSGSPRCNGGNPSPRGPQTFRSSDAFDGVPSSVVEVVFDAIVKFPEPVRVRAVGDFL